MTAWTAIKRTAALALGWVAVAGMMTAAAPARAPPVH